jgi:regulator of Ty1 transposition protein 103
MEGLEKLLAANKAALSKDETQLAELVTKKVSIEGRKRQVEDMIVRETSSNGTNDVYEPPRPNAEPLTPPPIESITPIGSPKVDSLKVEPEAKLEPSMSIPNMNPTGGLPSLNLGLPKSASEPLLSTTRTAESGSLDEPASKRRRLHNNDDEFVINSDAFGVIEPDVAAMLAK